nr:unnamed protein product [Digitaria exilis]
MAAVATETPFHVLAVDDSLPDRKLIERLLKTSSFQVTTVDSGSKALEFLGIHHDSSTPISVQEDQLESSSLRDIPVVIMSSENIPSRINRCLEEGADEFFLKPVRLSDMSKLKPHILKSRCKEHYNQQSDGKIDESSSTPTNSSSSSSSSSDNSNSRKRKAEGDAEILPKANRSRHS